MRGLFASCVLLLIILSACSRTDPQPPMHSKASVIVEQSAVTPGSRVNFGVQFVTENGWHIYWQNPGDSGEPARIRWQLPSGITAGTLDWPTPIRLTTTAGTDYGYEGTTVLLSSLQVPATAQPGRIDVVGDVRWLVCRDLCIPQRTQVKIPVRIAQTMSIDDDARRLLQSAGERLPKPLPANMQPVAVSTADGFRLTLVSKERITQAQFFPGEQEQVDNGAPQKLTAHAGKTSLTLKKSEHLREEPLRLRGVIVLNGKDAYQVDVPIQSSAAQKGSSHR
jgi:DsbC/DsbD-like thiol-disulfide interchange protein